MYKDSEIITKKWSMVKLKIIIFLLLPKEVFVKQFIFITALIIMISSITLGAEWKAVRRIPTTPYSGDFTIWKGKIWQIDIVDFSVVSFDIEKNVKVMSFPTPDFYPYSIAIYKDTLIVSNNRGISFINPDGKIYRTIYSPATKITGLAFDGTYIWVAEESGKIYCILKDDGTTIKTLDCPGGKINGLTYSDGYLWTTSRHRDEIYMVDPKRGEVVNILPSPGPYPSGIYVKDNRIYISDFEKDSIFVQLIPSSDYIIAEKQEKVQVTLRWEIVNSGPGDIGNVEVYIAIPENLPNQRILKEPEFSPEPDDILVDRYGQKAAYYHLKNIKPEEHHILMETIEAELSSVNYFILPAKVKGLKDIPKDLRDTYLQDNERFRIKDPFIKKAVKEAVGDEKNPYWIARKILDYVVDKIDYELSGGWDVAPEVLKRGKGSCSEYAYVYISLMRAAGIPARYVGSVQEKGDRASIDPVFHRWVEIYLPGYGWVPVDIGIADSPYPRNKALAIGHRAYKYLITTHGGGDSEHLEWNYNFNEKITNYDSGINFMVRRYAIWEPIREEKQK